MTKQPIKLSQPAIDALCEAYAFYHQGLHKTERGWCAAIGRAPAEEKLFGQAAIDELIEKKLLHINGASECRVRLTDAGAAEAMRRWQ